MNKSRIKNCALYQEICILRILVQMGYLSEDELRGISQIAAVDIGSLKALRIIQWE